MYFNAKTHSFSQNKKTDSDVVIAEETVAELLMNAMEHGKVIIANADGNPILADKEGKND